MANNCVWGMLFCVLLLSVFTECAPEGSLVTHLPGFNGSFPSKHYSGYVEVDGKNLFYYLVVSERSPPQDPVVLWLNGGPGCSSFDGFIYEHGPFNFEVGKSEKALPKLHLNGYSWSKVSNIIYLESPCGVGLSYSSDTGKYVTGDLDTASTTHAFLLKWFKLFPEFINNPFYIAGESYAGIYVPTLAAELAKGAYNHFDFVQGYMVGNGVTDEKFDGTALVPFAHGMALISDDIFNAIAGLNIYDILEPCYHYPGSAKKEDANESTSLPLSFQMLGGTERPLAVRKRMFGRAWPLWATVKDGPVPLWPQLAEKYHVACINDDVATTWLNNAEVREAIHAAPVNVSGPWELCTRKISYNHDAGSMIPYHKNLTSLNYRVLIYSGDHDMCVPYTGSEAWTRSLGYKTSSAWRSWWSNNQVAGYLQEYDNKLTFLTIKGAGHTVPEYKPSEALDFYTRWLDRKPI
ncbi:hypothetical protein CRG98_034479 [Punica granatum]|uniref:Carboxypeptidase n=1 Tax=Punica granatum TaxID=22663 RepID=A0A2I0IM71_PUNGR|nr:hypothetical protein CRG98_034479 [Punica granatum]